jgi:hypothetical protein
MCQSLLLFGKHFGLKALKERGRFHFQHDAKSMQTLTAMSQHGRESREEAAHVQAAPRKAA